MNETELMLRAAFSWVKATTVSDGIIKHSHPLDFVASGPVKIGDRTMHLPHLRHEGQSRTVTVLMSLGGRVLHYVDAYEHHSARLEMKLPREFWARAGAAS